VHTHEQLPANDNATRQRHLKKIAEIWERGAHDVGRALIALERAFHLDPGDAEVRATLRRLGATQGEDRWEEICAIYLRVTELAPRDEALALQHELARIRE